MENAFKTLGATPEDDRERLRELCDEKELLFDDASVYKAAYSDLINSKKRIIHEMTYLAGDVFDPYFALVSRKSAGRLATEKTAETIVSAGQWFSEARDDADDLIEEINESREASGFPSLEDDAVFSGETDELKRQCVGSLTALLDRASEESVVSLFNQMVKIEDFQCFFVDELMAYYELRMQETMDSERKACDGKLDSLLTKCNISWIRARNDTELQSDVDSLLNAVKEWDKIAQPLQVNMQKWGGQHEQSREFIHEMRNRIVQTVNDAQDESNKKLESIVLNSVYGYMSGSSRNEADETMASLRAIIETMETLTSKLIGIFSELETVAAQLKGDLTTLRSMKSQLPKAKPGQTASTSFGTMGSRPGTEYGASRQTQSNKGSGNWCGDCCSGCYIATCVYGSYDCPEVWTLRRYRDYHMSSNAFGRAFIKIYYRISPTLVKWFGNRKWFKGLFRFMLDRIVRRLKKKGYADTPYEDLM